MGIIHHTPYPQLPYETRNWTATGRWTVSLACILHGRHGRRKGQFLYTIFYEIAKNCSIPVYTGMTEKSIQGRLKGHVHGPSYVGYLINAIPVDLFSVEVIEIKGNLRMAERQRISKINPLLNRAERSRSTATVMRRVNKMINDYEKLQKRS